MADSILPPNAGRVERALERGVQAGDFDVAVIATLMDPARCPEALLGWLAWSFSVDTWREAWSEQRKRSVVAGAVERHRRKGTRAAVAQALLDVGLDAKLAEWFETGGAPGTFQVAIDTRAARAAGFVAGEELLAEVRRVVDPAKPMSAHFELVVGQHEATTVHVGVGTRRIIEKRQRLLPRGRPTERGTQPTIRTTLDAAVVSVRRHDVTGRDAA
ncbi:MAG: phage tail protein I [Shimia sp.]